MAVRAFGTTRSHFFFSLQGNAPEQSYLTLKMPGSFPAWLINVEKLLLFLNGYFSSRLYNIEGKTIEETGEKVRY